MMRGLDAAGFIKREPDRANLQPEYAEAVEFLRTWCRAVAAESFHSLYLYGSVARGEAIAYRSDLDALLVLNDVPSAELAGAIRDLSARLVVDFPLLTEACILLYRAEEIMSPAQRYDMGFFVKCLCTGIDGDDLAGRLPDCRPSLALAAGTNGNIRELIAAARRRLAAAHDDVETRAICRGIMRKMVRTGFTLVMPREQCWTNDLTESCALFAKYYPERADEMRAALQLAQWPSSDRAAIQRMLSTLGSWLAAEYDARILAQ